MSHTVTNIFYNVISDMRGGDKCKRTFQSPQSFNRFIVKLTTETQQQHKATTELQTHCNVMTTNTDRSYSQILHSVVDVDSDEGGGGLLCGSVGLSVGADESVGVDALLLAARNQCGDNFLQNLCPHLTGLKNLLMVYLLLPAVVQRHLQHDTGGIC